MDNRTNQPPPPITDLSPRVVQLARMLDRLPPGNYEISLQKQELNCAVGDGIWLDKNEIEELKKFYWRKDFWREEVTLEETKS